jgi:hypothetical protein
MSCKSNSKNFQKVIVTNGNPIGLRTRPLHLIDLAIGRIRQDGIFNLTRYLLYVPDQGLTIVSRRAYVTGGVWRPGDSVNARSVII